MLRIILRFIFSSDFFSLGFTRNNNGSSSSRWKPGATVTGMLFLLSPPLPLLQHHFVWNHSQLTGSETIKWVIKICSYENSSCVNVCLRGEAENFLSWLVEDCSVPKAISFWFDTVILFVSVWLLIIILSFYHYALSAYPCYTQVPW